MRTTSEARGARVAAAIALLLLVILGVFVERTTVDLRSAIEDVQHTHEVISRLYRLDDALGDAENARRAHALTADAAFVTDYEGARGRVQALRSEIRELTRDNVDQQLRMNELDAAIDVRMSALESAIAAQRGGADSEHAAAATRTGQALGLRVRGVLDAMVAQEHRLLDRRRDATEIAVHWQRRAQMVGAATALILFAWAVSRMRRESTTRARSEAALATTLPSPRASSPSTPRDASRA